MTDFKYLRNAIDRMSTGITLPGFAAQQHTPKNA